MKRVRVVKRRGPWRNRPLWEVREYAPWPGLGWVAWSVHYTHEDAITSARLRAGQLDRVKCMSVHPAGGSRGQETS